MNDDKNLTFLARAVVEIFVAGPQRPIKIIATGRYFDTDRKVRVEEICEAGEAGEDGEAVLVWEGTLSEWQDALRSALQRVLEEYQR